MTGPDAQTAGRWRLHVLYVLAAHHGSGLGRELLRAVLPEDAPTALWVVDPNPRARAFYSKSGFMPNGRERDVDGLREIEMVREAT